MSESRRITPKIAGKKPVKVDCDPGRYSWCACGFSQKQPFCDGSHREHSELRSVKVEIEEAREIEFCICKQTKTPPFCDGSHELLDDDSPVEE